ncbi:MAG: DUF4924 domain-containing protein [Bacteroidetes bacterium]|nr:MAG: DUF4924 domain-containing protein [Bacteroidota bacterium]
MIIAEQKRKENIAEYLLYMYQIEDMIRANGLDIERVEQTLINKFELEYALKREMREWYKGLISMMKDEGKEEKGHLSILLHQGEKMAEVHSQLLDQGRDPGYRELYEKARPHLEALRMRSGYSRASDVQIALDGLYGLLILRLKKARISEETTSAFATIRELIAELNLRYMDGGQ